MDAERRAWIFLNQLPHMGPMRFHRLLMAAQSAEAVLAMNGTGLQAAGVGPELAEYWHSLLREASLWEAVDQEIALAVDGTMRILTELDAEYPDPLREVIDRPPVLYVQGQWPVLGDQAVGIVGTRRSTSYGTETAKRFVNEFVALGVTTVSGLAAGIDTVVHHTTLDREGSTIAVLGHGFKHQFPRENRALFERIRQKGALVSEFPYDMPPQAGHFPRRNRIISGLSQAVLVIEAGERSGALITARYGAEQGKDVFAVPGRLGQPGSIGCHRLIKEGAGLAESAADVLRMPAKRQTPAQAKETDMALSTDAGEILKMLDTDALSIDQLSEKSGWTFDRLAESLLSLELANLVRVLPGQHYERC